jgi:hypothetical protein
VREGTIDCVGRGRWYDDVVAKGVEIVKPLRAEPRGMREFGIRTADGHRILFGSRVDGGP